MIFCFFFLPWISIIGARIYLLMKAFLQWFCSSYCTRALQSPLFSCIYGGTCFQNPQGFKDRRQRETGDHMDIESLPEALPEGVDDEAYVLATSYVRSCVLQCAQDCSCYGCRADHWYVGSSSWRNSRDEEKTCCQSCWDLRDSSLKI